MDLGQRMLESLNRPLVDAMDRAGLTLEKLIGRLKKELNANTTRIKKTVEKQENGEAKVTLKEVKEPIWDIRQKARIDAHKLRGDYAPVKVDHNVHGDLIDDLQAAKERARGGNNETE